MRSIVAPVLAVLDKVFHLLVNWDRGNQKWRKTTRKRYRDPIFR